MTPVTYQWHQRDCQKVIVCIEVYGLFKGVAHGEAVQGLIFDQADKQWQIPAVF